MLPLGLIQTCFICVPVHMVMSPISGSVVLVVIFHLTLMIQRYTLYLTFVLSDRSILTQEGESVLISCMYYTLGGHARPIYF